MPTPKKTLPPLEYLLAFEVAAKFESFAYASRELKISESAISRKVKLLEQHYETLLFRRGNKSISLTRQGANFLEKIQPALQILRESSSEMLESKNQLDINLAATNSVTALWLLPRLRDFYQSNASVKITITASDDDTECLTNDIDLAILRGDGNWPDHMSQKLFGEVIFPVCSPAFLEKNPGASDLTSLSNFPLIEVSSKHPEWMNWDVWLQAHSYKQTKLIKNSVFNTYPNAIQATLDGLGIALGWEHLIDNHLKSGALVRLFEDIQTQTKFGYYLLKHKTAPARPGRKKVEDWLISGIAEVNDYRLTPVASFGGM